MNKKIGSIFAYSVLSLLTLIGCNNNQSTSSSSSNSSSVSDSSTSSEISNSSSSSEESKYDYKLEDGEVEVVEYKKNLLTKPDFSLVEIEGIDKVAFDPFEYYYAFGEASYFYPNEDTIKDNVVLYSSNFYKQNTIKRNEDCKEYILNRIDSKIFEVKEIKEGSDNFIPFNGAVLSIPNCKGISYKVNDQITLNKGEIPLYKLGLYNQDGYRIAIRHANTQSWNNTGITLIDNNTLDFASYSSFKKAVCMNLVLSNDGKSYRVDKFRVNKNTGRVYSNVNDGICLLSDLEGYGFENLALFKGIRFNLNDKVFFENNDTLYNQSKTFKLNNTNYFSYNIDTDITIGVNIKKITKSTDSRWNFEAAVDENGTITEIGINVDIPKNGYKLLFSGTDSSSYSERVSVFVSENFKVGAHVELSDGKVIVDYNNESYVSNLYDVANNMYKKINTELVTYNYSYDYKTITSVGKSLKEINTQIDELIYNEDSLSRYKIYAIIGKLKQIIQDLEASTSINRAAQVKTTWYITDFTNNDKDLSHLIKNLERIRKSGINEIIVNAMDNGKVYYSNSKIYTKSLTDISFGEYGHDYIKAIISEAHKLNMKVFINFTPFTDGIENNFTELKKKELYQ